MPSAEAPPPPARGPGRPTEGTPAPAPDSPRAAPLHRMLLAQTAVELRLTLRRGESVLVTVLLPALLLVFFSTVPLLPLRPAGPGADPPPPVQAVFPGVLALAVMSTAMVSLGIATAFERQYGVLKRLGGSPFPRGALLGAKTLSVLAVEALQVALLAGIALALGWRPPAGPGPLAVAGLALVLGTAAFGGLGLWMAGSWRAEGALAGANALFLLLLLLGGVLVPPGDLPGPLRLLAPYLPSAALSGALRGALLPVPAAPPAWGGDLALLALWAAFTPTLAALTFRWE